MSSLYSIFPMRCEWPDAVDDVSAVPNDAVRIRLVSGAKNIDRLPMYSGLRALWCFDVGAEALKSIGSCVSLESLYIENIKTENLSSLKGLPGLKILGLDTCSRASSLIDIGKLHSLQGLAITNFKNVHDLGPLSGLGGLRALAVSGSMWKRMRVATLKPLGALMNLELLHLTNIKAEDDVLRSLEALTNLRKLDIANFYPMSEFARLSQKLRSTECTWFEPYVELSGVTACKKCGGATMIMLTGKGKPLVCTRCDGNRLEKHIRAWCDARAAATA